LQEGESNSFYGVFQPKAGKTTLFVRKTSGGRLTMEFDIVRAWKDARYRQGLTSEQQAMLPENPIGAVELTNAELETVQGGSFGNDQMGSYVAGGDCLISFGGGPNSCNTFAKYAVNCSNSGNTNPDPPQTGVLTNLITKTGALLNTTIDTAM
jgi:mersacidin/lichenicidin family type 2 lantibiotic